MRCVMEEVDYPANNNILQEFRRTREVGLILMSERSLGGRNLTDEMDYNCRRIATAADGNQGRKLDIPIAICPIKGVVFSTVNLFSIVFDVVN